MNDKTQGLIRHILTFGGGYAASQGWIDEELMLQLVGAGITIIGFIWSFKSKKG
jgi:hypothetical protein|tara:strand:- start:1252 stop:1413 length:162 start_codon:yes stop_codon:yes gene_type:complete